MWPYGYFCFYFLQGTWKLWETIEPGCQLLPRITHNGKCELWPGFVAKWVPGTSSWLLKINPHWVFYSMRSFLVYSIDFLKKWYLENKWKQILKWKFTINMKSKFFCRPHSNPAASWFRRYYGSLLICLQFITITTSELFWHYPKHNISIHFLWSSQCIWIIL